MVEERHHPSEKGAEAGAAGVIAAARLVGLFRRPAAVIDSGNRMVAANPPFCRLFRLDSDQVPGGRITDLAGVEWRDGLSTLYEGLSLGRLERSEFEVRAPAAGQAADDAAKIGFAVELRGDLARAIDLNGSLAAAESGMREAGVTLL